MDLLERVSELLSEEMGVNQPIRLETDIYELGMDSTEMQELCALLEIKMGVAIPRETGSSFVRIGELMDFLEQALANRA